MVTLLRVRARAPARWRRLAGALLLAAAIAAGSARDLQALSSADSPDASPGTAARITIRRFEFDPQTISIAPGRTARWINADVANHQISTGVVVAGRPRPDGRVTSPLLVRGDTVAVTFQAAGVYPYYCAVHPFMQGRVVVVTPEEAP